MSLRVFPNHLGKHTLTSIDRAPFVLDEDKNYIICSWNSNTHVTGTGGHSFKVIGHYGSDLEIGKEYLWNKASDEPMKQL